MARREITPVSWKAGQVKLQIRAPRDVPVDRIEIHARKLAGHS